MRCLIAGCQQAPQQITGMCYGHAEMLPAETHRRLRHKYTFAPQSEAYFTELRLAYNEVMAQRQSQEA